MDQHSENIIEFIVDHEGELPSIEKCLSMEHIYYTLIFRACEVYAEILDSHGELI